MKKVLTNLLISCIAVVATFSISLTLVNKTYIFLNGNSFVWILVWLAEIFLIKMAFKNPNKRLYMTCVIIAIILSTTQVIGSVLNNYLDLSLLIQSKRFLLLSIIRFIGCLVNFTVFLILVYQFLNKKIDSYNAVNLEKFIYKIYNRKYMFFIIWGIIFILYIPYFINYFPGIMTPDSFSQFGQAVGIYTLNNHHPVFHTIIILLCSKVGALVNNYNIGVAAYSIIQMIFLSGCFAYAIYYMLNKKTPLSIITIFFIYYAIYPIHGLYSITMWKDIPFAACMLLLTIIIANMAIDKKTFFSSKSKVLLVLFFILISLFRNNGIYVAILSLAVFLFANNKYFKKMLIYLGVVILSYVLWKGVIFKKMNIVEGSVGEALSIPMQQLARTINNHGEEMKEEDKQEIFRFFYKDTIGEEYNPIISDPVKNLFNADEFKQNKRIFIKLWIKNLVKYPGTYIESFLCNSYGYWYPEAQHWIVARDIYESDLDIEREFNLHQTPIMNLLILEKFDSLIDNRTIPIMSMVFSIGAYFYVLCIFLGYTIYAKKYNLILTYIPILMLWLTCLASPVYAEFRYIYSMFTCLPVIISLIFINKKNED